MTGRRTKLTPIMQDTITQLLEQGNTRAATCQSVDVDTAQFYRWMKRSAAFRSAVTHAEAAAEIHHVQNIRTAAYSDWRASMEWLARRRPGEWGKRDTFDVAAVVRALGVQQGLSEDRIQIATAKAEQYLRELPSGRR